MKKFLFGVLIGIFMVFSAYFSQKWLGQYLASLATVSPLSKMLEKPLEKYEILRLSGQSFPGSQIVLDAPVATTSAYTAYMFHFSSNGKRVNGLAHIPNGASETNKKPVLVQLRGYADRKSYVSGIGTAPSARVYAANGYISLAPDFLGYGGSDMPSTDPFEERFQTYTTALNLLASVKTLPMGDASRVGIWGHSNGGQIALTILEIEGKSIPATLWAPVSKPFPYSILYYTDDAQDHGRQLRKVLASFEQTYNTELYSLTNYLDRIRGPLQIHQGSADTSVPQAWSDALVKEIEASGSATVNYYVYPGADHNMLPDAWNTVVARDISFFQKYLH